MNVKAVVEVSFVFIGANCTFVFLPFRLFVSISSFSRPFCNSLLLIFFLFFSSLEFFKQKKVEPWKLYTMVSGLLAVDLVILLTWQFTDPLQRRLETFPLEKPLLATDDIRISPELEHCESENQSIWLGT